MFYEFLFTASLYGISQGLETDGLGSTEIHIPVTQDFEELSSGFLYVDSSDLELQYDNGFQLINLWFDQVDIPAGSVITAASVSFTPELDQTGRSPKSFIYAHASGKSSEPQGANAVSLMETTKNNVLWNDMGAWTDRVEVFTPDISNILNEVISRDDWRLNNSLSIILKQHEDNLFTDIRRAFSSEGGVGPQLHIQYEPQAASIVQFTQQSYDDVEEFADGELYVTSSDLELMYDGDIFQMINIRFTGIEVPKDAEILGAEVVFQADESNNVGSPVIVIQGHANATSSTPVGSFSISNRPTTSARTEWTLGTWVEGQYYNSPSIVSVIQELVGRPDWEQGNSLSLLITGANQTDTSIRTAESSDGTNGPILNIAYLA